MNLEHLVESQNDAGISKRQEAILKKSSQWSKLEQFEQQNKYM